MAELVLFCGSKAGQWCDAGAVYPACRLAGVCRRNCSGRVEKPVVSGPALAVFPCGRLPEAVSVAGYVSDKSIKSMQGIVQEKYFFTVDFVSVKVEKRYQYG